MEPDHCANLGRRWKCILDMQVICNAKTVGFIQQFFSVDVTDRIMVIKEGDTFSSGKHVFTFVMAPMVHWPEAMVTYVPPIKFCSPPMHSEHGAH